MTATKNKYVYFFGDGKADGNGKMKELLGGKGANLGEMANIGLPVPAGFTITTEVCTYYYAHDKSYPPELKEQVLESLKKVEKAMGAEFGSTTNPLLLSCRSGARESMPGMMDTILNIGLNDEAVQTLAKASGSERFAYDSYRRLIQMYGEVVMGMKPQKKEDPDYFEHMLEEKKAKVGVHYDNELTAEHLKELVKEFKSKVREVTGEEFPTDPHEQLWGAVGAVFKSWGNDRAVVYRRDYGIPHEWGTATNVQAMVFGNLGDDCATGVGLTRDCAVGVPIFNGDYLINAQGEDVVAGIRTPKRIEETLSKDLPDGYKQLEQIAQTLERHFKEVQDIEFTIQKGKVWMLQTRNAKRTGFAAVRIAVDFVNEGLITPKEALQARRIPANDLNQLLQPVFDVAAKKKAVALTKGINAGPGAATGQIVFHASDAEAVYEKDKNAQMILVRRETSPEDLRGMRLAKGILTAFGGASSHAALVSRQMGKTCIVGASELEIDYHEATVKVAGKTLKEGDWISIDGFTGEVFEGKVETRPSEIIEVLLTKTRKPEEAETYRRYAQLMEWVDQYRTLGVRANAEADDAEKSAAFGAEGVGLCRTEHMFFSKLDVMREMILAEAKEEREKAVAKLLPHQRDDFKVLFKAMAGKPVTIRLLDPPLHEFLSEHHLHEQPDLVHKLADMVGKTKEEVYRRVEEIKEQNPMLGFRGCRLGIVYPEITAMQSRAIFEAACELKKEGVDVKPEVMIPLAGFKTEYENQEKIVRSIAAKVFEEQKVKVDYLVGTMIEIPRAALTADQIASKAEFFSFGTNDLTQTCLGMSRDDYGPFIGYYRENDIVPNDPFQTIDQEGVGRLMKIGVEGGRNARHDLKIGICGEHGGDPASVMFCHRIGLNYVSCSPFRIPIAKLAAAQVALQESK